MIGCDFHPEARDDLDEIWEFVSADSVDAADRLIAEILSRIRGLTSFPNRGHRRPDLTARQMRFLRVHEYLIAYATNEKSVWIVAVLHGRRDPRILAALLRSRE